MGPVVKNRQRCAFLFVLRQTHRRFSPIFFWLGAFLPCSSSVVSQKFLYIHDRATLAERLLARLEELSEEEAERLWAEEAQRRLEEYRAGRAKAVRAEEVHDKAERLCR